MTDIDSKTKGALIKIVRESMPDAKESVVSKTIGEILKILSR